MEKTASEEANRISHAESMSSARPYVILWAAAITGTRHFSIADMALWNS